MKKVELYILSFCIVFFLFLTGCGGQIEGGSVSAKTDDTSTISEKKETNNSDNTDVTVESVNTDVTEESVDTEVIEDITKNTHENDTDLGLKSIKIDATEVNLTEEQKAVLEYFDNDYLPIPSYDFLRRYPNLFQGTQVEIFGSVVKVLSMDNDNYELVLWVNVDIHSMYYTEDYVGNYVVIRGKTDSSSWYMEDDVLMVYGRYSGVETIDMDGTSYTIPCVNAYRANYSEIARFGVISNDRFNYQLIKRVAEAVFGKDIEIREPLVDDFSEDTALTLINAYLGYCPTIEDAREQERKYGVSEAFSYYLVELENQSNANFTKFLFSTSEGRIVDAKDPPFDGVFKRYVEFSADFEHFFLFTYNTSLETLKLSYYDKDLHKVWDREFEGTTSAVYDYTENNIYIVVNNELYIINIDTGEDTFAPSYIGSRVAIRKFSDGILTVSKSKSDGIVKTKLDGSIQWKANLTSDVHSVEGIQLVGDNLVIQYTDDNWDDHYVLINNSTGEIIINAKELIQ